MNARARRYELAPGEVGWPTVQLCLGALTVQTACALGAMQGRFPAAVSVLAASACAYIQFTVAHDACHGSASRKPWLNEALGVTAALVLFAPFAALRRNHLHHHAHTNDPDEDPDFWVAGTTVIGTTARLFTQHARHYWCYFSKLCRRDKALRQAFVLLGFLAACLAAAVHLGHAKDFLLYWFLPSQLGSAALALTFDYWPHRPHRARGRMKDTAVIAPRWLDPFFLNQNIHLLHHLYPTIPWYRYRAAFDELEPAIRAGGGMVWDFRTALSKLRPAA